MSAPKHPPYAYEGSSCCGVPRYPPQKCIRHPELDEPLHTELAAALQESEKTVHSRTLINYVMYVILHFESWLDI